MTYPDTGRERPMAHCLGTLKRHSKGLRIKVSSSSGPWVRRKFLLPKGDTDSSRSLEIYHHKPPLL